MRKPLFRRVRTGVAAAVRRSRVPAFVCIAAVMTACGGNGTTAGSALVPAHQVAPQRDRVDVDPPTATPTAIPVPTPTASPEDRPNNPNRGRGTKRDRVDVDPGTPSPAPTASATPDDHRRGGHDPIDRD